MKVNGNGKKTLANGKERSLSFNELGSREQHFLRNHAPDPRAQSETERKRVVREFRKEFLGQFSDWETTLQRDEELKIMERWMEAGANARKRHQAAMKSRQRLAPTSF